MRTVLSLLLFSLFASLFASPAVGQNVWFFWTRDGSLILRSNDGADASWDGYTLTCETGCLDPDGWYSIADAVADGPQWVTNNLGRGALSFGEANPSNFHLSELNVSGGARLGADRYWYLGKPFNVSTSELHKLYDEGKLRTSASGNGSVVDADLGCFRVCIPEPSSLVLAGLAAGALTFLSRRKKDAKSGRRLAPWVRCLAAAIVLAGGATTTAQEVFLEIDYDGVVYFRSSTPNAATFDGYSLACSAGCLDPAGWYSIADAASSDPLRVTAELGPGALAFGEARPTNFTLGELNVSGAAIVPPGEKWSIGRPIAGTVTEISEWAGSGVLSLVASGNGVVLDSRVVCVDGNQLSCTIPEPSTLALSAMTVVLFSAASWRRRVGRPARRATSTRC